MTMAFALQLSTFTATPFTCTALPARKPMPLIVTLPPAVGILAGNTSSA